MRRDQLTVLDDTADAIGQLHSRLEELDVEDLEEAAAVAKASELLSSADEILTTLYVAKAPAIPIGEFKGDEI